MRLIPAGNEFVWKIDPDIRKTVERTVENPVEVSAYNMSAVTDLLVGLPGDAMTTDARKSELLFAKVLECRAEGHLLPKADYERILHPPLEVVGRAGRWFERGLNGLGSAVTASARALGLARAPLHEQVDFAAAVGPVEHDASSIGGSATSETPSHRRTPSEMV